MRGEDHEEPAAWLKKVKSPVGIWKNRWRSEHPTVQGKETERERGEILVTGGWWVSGHC
jgi:hypothetical protein